MLNFLNGITLKEFLQVFIDIVVILSVIAEKSKKLPINPWTAIFKWIGKCLTLGLAEDIKVLKEKSEVHENSLKELDEKIERKFAEKQKDSDEKEAKRLRANIIAFSDSCRIHTKHTKQHFENVFREIDDYNLYCKKNGIPNHYIDGEISYIKSIYCQCLKDNSFL